MNLREKTLLVVGVTFIALIAILVITSNIFVLGGYVDLESDQIWVVNWKMPLY